MKDIEMIHKLSVLHCILQMIASADGGFNEERDQEAAADVDDEGFLVPECRAAAVGSAFVSGRKRGPPAGACNATAGQR